MAKKKKEEVVEQAAEQPIVDDTVEKIQVKKKSSMKKFDDNPDGITKVDLSNLPKQENEQPVDSTETKEVQEKVIEETTNKEEIVEQTTEENTETPVLEEVTEVEETVTTEQPEKVLPENVEKLVNFMNETGGDLNDYIKLNQNYDELDNLSLLEQYYTQTKPHLNKEEINFLMDDQFSYDESYDDEKEIKRKKLALKEQVASAKSHLDGQKSKYYEDIKAGSKLTGEQQNAIDFFNRYNEKSEQNQKAADTFLNKTEQVFNDKFKGFEYNVGDKKYRFNVKDANQTKETQSDINNFVKKFLNKNNMMEDAKGYHKGLFTAMNSDAVANHFYDQGKADALKESVARSKNINMDPRQSHSGNIDTGGVKVRVIGDNSPDFKFKIKQKQQFKITKLWQYRIRDLVIREPQVV